MNAAETLRMARENGVRLGVAGADLILDADQEPTHQVLDAIRHHKAGIVALLTSPEDDWKAADWQVFYNERAVGVTLPSHIVMTIAECEPGVKGDTATNVTKGATLETGLEVHVPLFIKVGEKIKVDTRTGSYVERVND